MHFGKKNRVEGKGTTISNRQRALIEEMEARRFLTVTGWQTDTVSNLTGDFWGEVLVGDNGDPYGTATAGAGAGNQQVLWETPTWDQNVSNGFDSDWHYLQLWVSADDGGDLIWQATDDDAEAFSIGSGQSIHSVTIRADVNKPNMRMDWKDLSVRFYYGEGEEEVISLSDMHASTMVSGSKAETGVVVTGSHSGYYGAVVTGMARLQAAAGAHPSARDIFGQFLVS